MTIVYAALSTSRFQGTLKIIPDGHDTEVKIPNDVRKKYGINIMGLKENGRMNLTITPDIGITARQTILVLGTMKQIQRVFHL